MAIDDNPARRLQRLPAGNEPQLVQWATRFAGLASIVAGEDAAGMALKLTAFLGQFFSAAASAQKSNEFSQGVKDALGDHEDRLEVLEKAPSATQEQAAEAILVAVRKAEETVRPGKARLFGRIIGSTLAADHPNWSEAAEFVRDVESLTDADIVAVRLLWDHQRSFYERQDGTIDTGVESHHITNSLPGLMAAAAASGSTAEEFEARCSRLMGFGLALLVTNSLVRDGPTRNAFRLTRRAVRLLTLLGYLTNSAPDAGHPAD